MTIYYDVTGVKGVADDRNRSVNENIGAILQIAGTLSSHKEMRVSHFSHMLSVADGLGQLKVFYNQFGQCMGFVVWALLDREVEHRIVRTKRVELRDFEWNEGHSLWIVDFLIRPGSLQAAMEYMRDDLFRKYKTVTYGRRRNGELVFKRTSRDSKSAFWSRAADVGESSGASADGEGLGPARL